MDGITHSEELEQKIMALEKKITEIEEREKREIDACLRQVQRMEAVGVLAGGIAHDFNNILSIIAANIELILNNKQEDDPERLRLQNAVDACFRASELVNQLITFSRAREKERFPLKINFMVKESLKLLGPIIPPNISITQQVRYESGKVFCDPAQINQLMTNICINAIHAMEESGGKLDVSLMNVNLDEHTASEYQLANSGSYVNLTVKDTGVGIDPKIKDRIFEPYFTTKEGGKGSGLGLSVVYGIVRDSGGSIKIDSAPGKGTTVNIFFPVFKEQPAVEMKKTVDESKKNLTVLFVDDEEAIVEITRLLLERLGYNVKSTTSSHEALEIFKSNPVEVDLVISDVSMPEMGGKELIENILSIRPNIPTIMCTGDSGLITEEEVKKIGVSYFLRKPFKKDAMMRALKEALGA